MKFIVKALNECGDAALRRHVDDTKALSVLERTKAAAVVKHKVLNDSPFTISLKPSKVALMAAKITPSVGLHRLRHDYLLEISKTMAANGAGSDDYEVLVK